MPRYTPCTTLDQYPWHMQAVTAGLAIVIMDYLTDPGVEWVAESVMLDQLKVHQKILRRALKYLERVRSQLPLSHCSESDSAASCC